MQLTFSARPVAWGRMSRARQMSQGPQAAQRVAAGNGSMPTTEGSRAVAAAPPGERQAAGSPLLRHFPPPAACLPHLLFGCAHGLCWSSAGLA